MLPSLRRLPFVVHPLPDETFESWFEAMASAHRATAGEMAKALGLHAEDTLGPLTTRVWTRALTDAQRGRLEDATGLSDPVLSQMTRIGFAANAVQFDRTGKISAHSPATGFAGRFCPECLIDSGGRWRHSWEFAFGFACIRHRRLLVATCPTCGRRPRRSTLPRNLVPNPLVCRNPDSADPFRKLHRCRGLLTESPSAGPLHPDVVSAQRFLLGVLARGQSAEGIWASGSQSTLRVLADLRFLRRFLVIDDTPLALDWTWQRAAFPEDGSVRRWQGHQHAPAASSVEEAAAAYTAAWRLTQQPQRVRDLLRGQVAPHVQYSLLSSQMQSLVAEAKGSRRRPTAFLQTSFEGGDPARRAAKIPAQLWELWTRLLAPNRVDSHVAAGALSAAIVFSGSRLTHMAAIALLDESVSDRRISYVMQGLGGPATEVDTLALVAALAEHLDGTPTPIDYARRRSLDYARLLPESLWEELALELNVHTGTPRRGVLARAYLHRVLSGDGPHRLRARQGAQPTDMEIDAFSRSAPEHVIAALHRIGEAFLAECGIEEPLTWCPDPAALPASLSVPAPARVPTSAADRSWKVRRSARGPSRGEKETEIVAAYLGGASVRGIATQMCVSKQSVSRVLDAHGIVRRPGGAPVRHTVDPVWLAAQRARGSRTIVELATEIGCSPSTVRRLLRTANGPSPSVGGRG